MYSSRIKSLLTNFSLTIKFCLLLVPTHTYIEYAYSRRPARPIFQIIDTVRRKTGTVEYAKLQNAIGIYWVLPRVNILRRPHCFVDTENTLDNDAFRKLRRFPMYAKCNIKMSIE